MSWKGGAEGDRESQAGATLVVKPDTGLSLMIQAKSQDAQLTELRRCPSILNLKLKKKF